MSDSTTRHRQQFPALSDKAYFNYGGQGPLPTTALSAIHQGHQFLQQAGPFSQKTKGWITQEATATRQAIATELGAPPEAITLTENVSVGCNIPLWGIPWQAGDHILLSDCEHPGIVAAVQEIQRRYGVDYSVCPLMDVLPKDQIVTTVAEHLRPQTRLVILSHILWNTGQVLPLQDIGMACRHHPNHPWVLVDAAQSVGVLPLNLSELAVDFYAFTGHKWWCGPAGVGGLYIRPEILADLNPTFIGWRGITIDGQGNSTGWEATAQRFEVATSDYPLYSGLREAIACHHQWGTTGDRYQRIQQLSQILWEQLMALPEVDCLCPTPPDAGLVAFQLKAASEDLPQAHRSLVQFLEDQHILTRTLLSPSCVRACVHYFTLESELEQLIQAIQSFLKLHYNF